MTVALRLIVPTLLTVLALQGCRQSQGGVADVPPPPPADYYGSAATPPADPFAPPAVSPVEPAPVVAAPVAPSAGGGSYVVQKGDTLWSIATRVYGDGQRWKDIAAANPGVDPNRIKDGQTLVLP